MKAIRERTGLTPEELAPHVGAKSGVEILAYEDYEDDLLVPALKCRQRRQLVSLLPAEYRVSERCGCATVLFAAYGLSLRGPSTRRSRGATAQ